MQSLLFRCSSIGLAFLLVLSLGACGSTALTRTIQAAIPALGEDVTSVRLDPKLRYLRVAIRGHVALMVLGYAETHPDGEIEVWYSQEGEVIRLQNGRIVGTAGLETDWRAVRSPSLPSWREMAGRTAFSYERELDEMPGYKFGIAESVSLRAIPAPVDSKLVGWEPHDLRWFEESVAGQPDSRPAARFGLLTTQGDFRVIYGEQCLAQNLCLAWQAWPAAR